MKSKEVRNAYLNAISKGVSCKASTIIHNDFRLTTSFRYSDNDLIDLWIYQSRPPNQFLISDKGETFRKESDIKKISVNDIEEAKILARSMGVGIENCGIFKICKKKKDFGQALFDVAYTCQAISVLFSSRAT